MKLYAAKLPPCGYPKNVCGGSMNMKLDKYKIREKKLGFIILCALFVIGIAFISQIADFFAETAEVGATVVHTYDTAHVRSWVSKGVSPFGP